MTDDEIIAVVQAHKEGKKIECHYKTSHKNVWGDAPSPVWDFSNYDYRVKVEPRVVYINEFPSGGFLYKIKEDAIRNSTTLCSRVAVKFVEVIEEDSK